MQTDDENPNCYYAFARTWWVENPSWPNGLEPCAGKRRTLKRNLTYSEAQEFCRQWNAKHKPGRLSRKCEFDVQR